MDFTLALRFVIVVTTLAREDQEPKPPAVLQQRVSALVVQLGSTDAETRARAAGSLQEIGSDATSAVPAIAQVVRHDTERSVRAAAIRAIGAIRADNADATRSLIEVVSEDGEELRSLAKAVLASLVPLPSDVVLDLARLLRHGDPSVRLFGVARLAEIGCEARAAASALAELAHQDPDPIVRITAAKTLSAIDQERATPMLSVMLAAAADDNEEVRREAMLALGSTTTATTTPASAVIPALLSGLADTSDTVRSAAAESLGSLGTKAETVIAGLTKALHDVDPRVRLHAAQSLGQVGGGDTLEATSNELRVLLTDSALEVRLGAAGALVRLGVAGAAEREMLRRTIAEAPDEVSVQRARRLLQAIEARLRD